ncbi:MAG: hypothetical protein WDZ74_02060 [Candidatus Paceibacterota bacterium]
MSKESRPIKCRISTTNGHSFRIIERWCRRHNLFRHTDEEGKEGLVLYASVSRKHRGVLDTMIKDFNGVTVRVISKLPKPPSIRRRLLKSGGVKTGGSRRVFSKRQEERMKREELNTEPFEQSWICGVPIQEIREWAQICSKGEFLRWHNITAKDFNKAVLEFDGEVDIHFTYSCPTESCGYVFSGKDALKEFRKHILRIKHSRAR